MCYTDSGQELFTEMGSAYVFLTASTAAKVWSSDVRNNDSKLSFELCFTSKMLLMPAQISVSSSLMLSLHYVEALLEMVLATRAVFVSDFVFRLNSDWLTRDPDSTPIRAGMTFSPSDLTPIPKWCPKNESTHSDSSDALKIVYLFPLKCCGQNVNRLKKTQNLLSRIFDSWLAQQPVCPIHLFTFYLNNHELTEEIHWLFTSVRCDVHKPGIGICFDSWFA